MYANFTPLPRGLSFLCAELGSTHLDPWLAKLTCERALNPLHFASRKQQFVFFPFRFEPNLSSSQAVQGHACMGNSRRSNTSLPTSKVSGFTIPQMQIPVRHRENKHHKVNSWSIAGPAACFKLFHVTVMVEARIKSKARHPCYC